MRRPLAGPHPARPFYRTPKHFHPSPIRPPSRASSFAFALMAVGGCAAASGARPGTPDATTDRWRALVGCYQVGDSRLVLDTVSGTRLHGAQPGIRRARFAPEPAIVGAYWFVNEKGAVWVFRNDGPVGHVLRFPAERQQPGRMEVDRHGRPRRSARPNSRRGGSHRVVPTGVGGRLRVGVERHGGRLGGIRVAAAPGSRRGSG
jgi:hypothetical protein